LASLNLPHDKFVDREILDVRNAMKNPASDGERARAIIESACATLSDLKGRAPMFLRDFDGWADDVAALLYDATKLFCRALGEAHGQGPGSRWSPAFPELLLSQPERCGEALAKVQAGCFEEILDVYYASA
jgi:hypothetical protein